MLSSLERDLQAVKSMFSSIKYVAFHFIRVGDILLMQDGEQVATKEIVAKLSQFQKELYKFFFIDACQSVVPNEATRDHFRPF